MTDEIRITRRVALPDKYEFIEIEMKGSDFAYLYKTIEKRALFIKDNLPEPSPEISPKTSETIEQGDFMADLIKAGIDPSIIEFTANTAKQTRIDWWDSKGRGRRRS